MGKLKIKIPEALNDLSLYQYQEYIQIENPPEKDVLRIFFGVSDLTQIENKHVNYLVDEVTKVLNTKPTFQNTFTLGSKNFGFVPNLDAISYGENLDITNYMKENQTLHFAMAVLFRPIIKEQHGKYLIEPYESAKKYAEVLKFMPLGVCLGAVVFFYNLANDLLKAIPRFIQQEAKKANLEVSGEVIQQYTNSLKAMLDDLEKLQNYQYTNV